MSASPERAARRALVRSVAKRDGKRVNVLAELARKVDGALDEATRLPRAEAGAFLRHRENAWRAQALAARNRGDDAAADSLTGQAERLADGARAYGPADHPGVRLV